MAHTSEVSAPASFKIVVGLDFTEAGDFAFRQAAQMARGLPGCELHLVHVDDVAPSLERRRQMADQLRAYANDEAAASGGLQGVSFGIHFRAGKPVREILQLVNDLGANLVVVGTHKGPNLKSWLVGSTAERLLANAPCPVLISGPRPDAPEPQAPVIEPPCADCVRTRATTKGATWWCERHTHHGQGAHVFSYQREIPLSGHNSSIIPTGIDF